MGGWWTLSQGLSICVSVYNVHFMLVCPWKSGWLLKAIAFSPSIKIWPFWVRNVCTADSLNWASVWLCRRYGIQNIHTVNFKLSWKCTQSTESNYTNDWLLAIVPPVTTARYPHCLNMSAMAFSALRLWCSCQNGSEDICSTNACIALYTCIIYVVQMLLKVMLFT